MKKKALSIFLVVALVAIAATGTLAYFTAEDEAENVFTVGNVAIDLEEPSWDSTGSEDAPEVYPGEKLDKDPYVINTGKNPCFVRIKVTGLDSLSAVGAGAITLEGLDTENWTMLGDYYYYNHVVTYDGDTYNTTLKTETTKLFTGIRMPVDLKNGDATAEYSVNVYAEAVQAQGAMSKWADVKEMGHDGDVSDIAAWFATCMGTP